MSSVISNQYSPPCKRLRVGVYFLLFCVFALLCDGLFSYFFRGPFTFWRQFFLMCVWGIFVCVPKKETGSVLLPCVYACMGWVLARALLTFIELGFNPTRIGYSLFLDFAGIPFFILPLLVIRSGLSPNLLFSFFSLLGGFFGLGLLIDGISGGGFMFLKEDLIHPGMRMEDYWRYSFWAQSISTFGVISALCIVASLYQVSLVRNIFSQVFHLSCAVLICVGSWFSGSRQVVFPSLVVLFMGIVFYTFGGKGKKIVLLMFFFLGGSCLAIPIYEFLLRTSDNEKMTERFTIEAIKEDDRWRSWKAGWEETVEDPVVFVMGKGVAYTSTQHALPGEEIGFHYENTFFARLACTGTPGLVLLLLPVAFIVVRIFKQRGGPVFFDYLTLLFIGDFLLISFVSPNGLTPTSQISVYIMAGIYANKDRFLGRSTNRMFLRK